MYPIIANLIIFACLLSSPFRASALPSDRQEVMHVAADTASISQTKHEGIYQGHVELKQGTTYLYASEARTFGDAQNHLIKAVALGNQQEQAHYLTKTAEDKPVFHAYADKIVFLPLKHLVLLEGNARISQGKNSFAAAKITYDSLNKHVTSATQGKKRTSIIIYPEKKLQ